MRSLAFSLRPQRSLRFYLFRQQFDTPGKIFSALFLFGNDRRALHAFAARPAGTFFCPPFSALSSAAFASAAAPDPQRPRRFAAAFRGARAHQKCARKGVQQGWQTLGTLAKILASQLSSKLHRFLTAGSENEGCGGFFAGVESRGRFGIAVCESIATHFCQRVCVANDRRKFLSEFLDPSNSSCRINGRRHGSPRFDINGC